MATHTTPKNEVCTYSYDLRDRQTLANWNTTTPDTAKTYWANGLLKSIDNGVSKSDYAYNNRNLLTSETQTLAGRPARVVSYDYDADGLRRDLVYPSTRAVEYAWTSRAQLQSVSADGPPPIATYTYDKAGRNTALSHENTITESKSYDSASQLLANTHLKNGTAVRGHGYTLDATGRRTDETFADGSTPAREYQYDNADQVTSADYGNSQSDTYAYDEMGNRTSASFSRSVGVSPTNGTVTYNANNANQYTSITGLNPISHDANGNLLQQNGVLYTWDSENRLLSVAPAMPALGDKSLVHTYDGQHRRVTRTIREWAAGGWSATETTHFIYDGWNVIEEYRLNPSNSALVRNLTWGQDLGGSTSLQAAGGVGGLIMAEEINGTTTTAYHFHYDGNGNVTEVTDLSGNPAASYRYDAFGNTLISTGSYANDNRYRFSTKPLDAEVTNAPLYYYLYRYYDPATGRWPSRDPIEEQGGINLYGFVGNNGTNWIDHLGLEALAPDCCLKELSILKAAESEREIAQTLLAVSQRLLSTNQNILNSNITELNSMPSKIKKAISEVNWARADMIVSCEQGHGSFANSGCMNAIKKLTETQMERDSLLKQQASLKNDVQTGNHIVSQLTETVNQNKSRLSKALISVSLADDLYTDCVNRNANVDHGCSCL